MYEVSRSAHGPAKPPTLTMVVDICSRVGVLLTPTDANEHVSESVSQQYLLSLLTQVANIATTIFSLSMRATSP